jgi:hypothetical protein
LGWGSKIQHISIDMRAQPDNAALADVRVSRLA